MTADLDQQHDNLDPITLYGVELSSRLLLGTAQYPSPKILQDAIVASHSQIITVSVRRESSQDKSGQHFWSLLKETNTHILPNTAGCRSAKEAITTAQMARELFNTPWVKLEVIGNDDNLQPNVFELVEAAKELSLQGFNVFPYTTDDIIVAEQLLNAGCEVLMPWGSPIGSGRGLQNAHAMQLGYDAVLLNTAVAKSGKPVEMAKAFAYAVQAGRIAYQSEPIEKRDMAAPSTPVVGTPFWINS